jgi:hypothetical protein
MSRSTTLRSFFRSPTAWWIPTMRFCSWGPWLRSIARRPVSSSSSTTPNAYTSLCSVSFPVWKTRSIGNLASTSQRKEPELNVRARSWRSRWQTYQCVLRVEVAEGAQHPGGRVQVLVLLHQLGEPEVGDLAGFRRCNAEVTKFSV